MNGLVESTIVYEAEIEDPATGEILTVRALSLTELESEIDLAFGVLTDSVGRELAVAA